MAKKDPKKAQKIRNECIARWDNNWKYNKAIYHEMTQFVMGEQWKEDEAKLFETYKKIPLTVNKIAPKLNHLLGEQRQNTPNLQAVPDEDVEEDTVVIREALVKEISFSSDARVVYQTAFQQACVGGYSAYRVYTEYDNDHNFYQNIMFGAFRDPTKCYFDLGAESPSKVDGMFSGFRTTVTRKRFASLYGSDLEKKIGYTSDEGASSLYADDMTGALFSDEHSIVIIDHFERKSKMVHLYELSNGDCVRQKEFDELPRVTIEGIEMLSVNGEPVTVVQDREFPEYKVIHTKWAGDYRLEKAEFPSQKLPIIFVDQNSYYDKDGKQITRPFFKDARDSQRFINYLRTQIAYLIKVTRYDQFLVSKQNVKGNDTQAMWRDPSTQQGGLWYDESPNGNKPEQLRPPELSASLMLQYQEAARDIQETTGIFETQIGDQGNEISGAAIDARTRRGNANTFVPFDSLNRAIACGGDIVNEMIPKVYDTERLLNLDLKDVGRTQVTLNQPVDEYGMQTKNDMTVGKYKIRLVPGPSFEGQKAENMQSMDAVLSKSPETFGLIADLYVENLPMANNIEMRNRLRTVVPPEIIEAGKTGKPLPPKPPQQDPMLALKQQELLLKMKDSILQAQSKAHELNLKEQQLVMDSHQAGLNFSTEIAKLKSEKEEALAKAQEQQLRYDAEMKRIAADQHSNHTQNVVKILTHQPNHFKQPQQTETMND